MDIFATDQIFTLLNISLTGGMVIVFVLLIRFLMKQFPKKYICILWLIPFIRLLFGVSIPSAFSLLPIDPEPLMEVPVRIAGNEFGAVPVIFTGIRVIDEAVNRVLIQLALPSLGDSSNPIQIFAFVFGCIWMGGAVFFLGVNLFRYIRLKFRLSDAVLANQSESLIGEQEIKRIYVSDRIDMPMVVGIVRPRIYIPSFLCQEDTRKEREMILAHENAHRLRLDPWIKFIVFVVLMIHWFNPLVWTAYVLYCKDVEMACDEKVVEQLGEEKRKAYSLALLGFEEKKSTLCIPLAFGESHTKERIKHVLKYKKPHVWMGTAAVLLMTVFAVVLLTDPKGKMAESISVIGGVDGPTSIFVAGKIGEGESEKEEIFEYMSFEMSQDGKNWCVIWQKDGSVIKIPLE